MAGRWKSPERGSTLRNLKSLKELGIGGKNNSSLLEAAVQMA